MQRIATSVPMEDGRVKYRVRIVSDNCEPNSTLSDQMRWMLLENVTQNPSIIACGAVPFETFRMYHTGQFWVIEVEAVVIGSPNVKKSADSASSTTGRSN